MLLGHVKNKSWFSFPPTLSDSSDSICFSDYISNISDNICPTVGNHNVMVDNRCPDYISSFTENYYFTVPFIYITVDDWSSFPVDDHFNTETFNRVAFSILHY